MFLVNDLKYIYTQECGVATNVQPKDYSKQIHILGHLGKVILCIFSFYAYSCVKHGDQPLHFFPYNIWTQKNCKIKKISEHLLYYGWIFNYNVIGCGIDRNGCGTARKWCINQIYISENTRNSSILTKSIPQPK